MSERNEEFAKEQRGLVDEIKECLLEIKKARQFPDGFALYKMNLTNKKICKAVSKFSIRIDTSEWDVKEQFDFLEKAVEIQRLFSRMELDIQNSLKDIEEMTEKWLKENKHKY